MTLLIIITIVLFMILGVLFIPVHVDLSYTDDFNFKVSFLKITLFKSGKEKTKKKKTPTQPKEKKQKNSTLNDAKSYFKKKRKKDGFVAVVKEVMTLTKEVLSHIKWLLRYISISKVKLDVTVGTPDAAQTAIDYGMVCSCIYPVTALLEGVAHIGFKEINVTSDFENAKCDFEFVATVKMQIFYLAFCAFRVYKTFNKFVTEKLKNE